MDKNDARARISTVNDRTKRKVIKVYKTTSRIRDCRGFTRNVRKSSVLKIRNKEKFVTNIDASTFCLPLSRFHIQSEI